MTPPIPLFLLPGLLGDADVWAAQIEALGGRRRVVSAEFLDPPSMEGMARAVLSFAPRRFALAGHSMGGRVAMEVVRLAPERVERLALLDTGAHAVRPGEDESRGALVEFARREGMQALVERWLPLMVGDAGRADPALMARLEAMIHRGDPELFARQQAALLTRPDAEAHLSGIRCPTALIVGRQDGWSSPEQHEAIAALIPGATLTVIEDCGHMAPMERPGAVTDALARWLERES
jgi:pimeloyl-ACP methyl ester carboxylesterase